MLMLQKHMQKKHRNTCAKCSLRMIMSYKQGTSRTITRLSVSCIYSPTCSTYMFLCISRFGVFKGIKLGISRLLRCRGSKYDGGYDPVPKKTLNNGEENGISI
uniref:membrane protein insertion efficiency factor YidD n=2 Tax=Polynucleobacter sp. TaxID=2029855 RepID=UPI004047BAD0